MKRVEGFGPPNAKIMIIGEAPGSEEEKIGRPFVGSSGNLLSSCLANAGIKREDCYITNVVKVRPPANKLKRLKELNLTIESFYGELWEEVMRINPNVIVPLGNIPLKAVTGLDSISKWRGSILKDRVGNKVIPSFHPAACMRMWTWVYILTHDLKYKVKPESEFPKIKYKKREMIINPPFDLIMAKLDEYKKEEYSSVDIETFWNAPVIRCFGISPSETEALCIPLVKGFTPVWTTSKESMIWEGIRKVVKVTKVIAQNAQFEMTQLLQWLGGRMPLWMDTMRAQALVYPEFPHGLDFLNSIYTDIPYYKDDGKTSTVNQDWDMFQKYNCKDVLATFECAMKIKEELVEIGMWRFYQEYDLPLLNSLWGMQMRGVQISNRVMKKHSISTKSKRETLENELESVLGYKLNVKGRTQLKKLLHDDLGLPKMYHKKTGKHTMDADALTKLDKRYPNPILKAITKIRKLRTLQETFLELKVDKANRIHTSYGLTENGRLSSSQDIFGSGANLQNIPELIRDAFISDEGKVIVVGDLSQAENRIVAWLANELNLKSIFKTDKSVHVVVCSMIFNLREEDILADPNYKKSKVYKKAKNMVHAMNYDEGPRTFADHVDIPLAEAKSIMNEYDKLFPNIRSVFQAEVQAQLSQNRTLTNPFGRKRTFLGRWGPSLWREAYSCVPQGTVAEIINLGIIRMELRLPPGADILMQVHDEIVLQCYPKDLEEVCRIFREEVEVPIVIKGEELTIPLDISVGPNWKDTERCPDSAKEVS